MNLTTGMHIDRFVVEATLGRGGMATVVRVRHRALGTTHALKVLHLGHHALRERLIDEGRVQARLAHPNVVAVTDVLDIDGMPGLLMEYVHGPTLEEVLRRYGRLPVWIVERLVPGILNGVAAAHAANVVHRDLKPGNVLLQTQGNRVVPKVADFGLVKLLDDPSGRTASGVAMGTPNYMAPEQIRDARAVDPRSDIFAMGAILYELVTGRRAFPEENPLAVIVDIAEGNYEPVVARAPEAPEHQVATIQRALQLDPDDRFASCEELWSCWSPSSPSLSEVAELPLQWEEPWVSRLATLSPPPVTEIDELLALSEPSRGPTFVPSSPRASRAILMGLVAVFLAAAGLAAAWFAKEPPVEVVEPVSAHTAPALTAPIPPPPPWPAPEPTAAPAPEPDIVVSEPAPAAPSPPAEGAEAAAAATARVRVVGDAEVRLVGGDGAVPVGTVAAGAYRVEARFGEASAWVPAGRLVVEGGETVQITCRSAIRNCRF